MTPPRPQTLARLRSRPHRPASALAIGLTLAAGPACATDWNLSRFGTIGWAQSNRPEAYQRFIDDDGTWRRDTKLGAQLDMRLNPAWSATAQAMVRPDERSDHRHTAQLTWLFASWRPDNDSQIRVGKQRAPLFLNSENLEVGQTYELARLPIEVYALTPTQDVTGLYASRSWWVGPGEYSVEAAYGRTTLWNRAHLRDLGSRFSALDADIFSLVGNWRSEQHRLRAGWHHVRSDGPHDQGVPADYPLQPGGYYLVSGPGVPLTSHFTNDVLILSADLTLVPGWRLQLEGARNFQHAMHVAPSSAAGSATLIHQLGDWQPYVCLSRVVSLGSGARLTAALDRTVLPGQDEQTQLINASQRAAADAYPVVNQTSLALGTSVALSATSKLKLEWLQTRIGSRSSLIDSPAGGDPIRHQGVRVWSINHNFVF